MLDLTVVPEQILTASGVGVLAYRAYLSVSGHISGRPRDAVALASVSVGTPDEVAASLFGFVSSWTSICWTPSFEKGSTPKPAWGW